MTREEARANIHKAIDLFVDSMLALQEPAPAIDSEMINTTVAGKEAGYHPTTIGIWCRKGLIDGAAQLTPAAPWRFTRGAWRKFLDSGLRRSRSRLRSVA